VTGVCKAAMADAGSILLSVWLLSVMNWYSALWLEAAFSLKAVKRNYIFMMKLLSLQNENGYLGCPSECQYQSLHTQCSRFYSFCLEAQLSERNNEKTNSINQMLH
jgi:hypothetical protein